MNTEQRRATPAPCIACGKPIRSEQEVIFCPDCGEPYHDGLSPRDCWKKVGKKCRVHGCGGKTYILWSKLETYFLKFLGVKRSKLLSECPHCSNRISPLYRFCIHCGHDVNPPKAQKSFIGYPLAKWLHTNHRILFATLSMIVLLLGGTLIIGIVKEQAVTKKIITVKVMITSTPKIIYITATPLKGTSTPTLISFSHLPKPTYTPRVIPTKLPASCPGAPYIRVRIDDLARVTSDGRPLRLRSTPEIQYNNIVLKLPEGTRIKIRYGPVCADGYAFWQVKIKSTGVQGWVAEGDRNNYYIETVKRP